MQPQKHPHHTFMNVQITPTSSFGDLSELDRQNFSPRLAPLETDLSDSRSHSRSNSRSEKRKTPTPTMDFLSLPADPLREDAEEFQTQEEGKQDVFGLFRKKRRKKLKMKITKTLPRNWSKEKQAQLTRTKSRMLHARNQSKSLDRNWVFNATQRALNKRNGASSNITTQRKQFQIFDNKDKSSIANQQLFLAELNNAGNGMENTWFKAPSELAFHFFQASGDKKIVTNKPLVLTISARLQDGTEVNFTISIKTSASKLKRRSNFLMDMSCVFVDDSEYHWVHGGIDSTKGMHAIALLVAPSNDISCMAAKEAGFLSYVETRGGKTAGRRKQQYILLKRKATYMIAHRTGVTITGIQTLSTHDDIETIEHWPASFKDQEDVQHAQVLVRKVANQIPDKESLVIPGKSMISSTDGASSENPSPALKPQPSPRAPSARMSRHSPVMTGGMPPTKKVHQSRFRDYANNNNNNNNNNNTSATSPLESQLPLFEQAFVQIRSSRSTGNLSDLVEHDNHNHNHNNHNNNNINAHNNNNNNNNNGMDTGDDDLDTEMNTMNTMGGNQPNMQLADMPRVLSGEADNKAIFHIRPALDMENLSLTSSFPPPEPFGQFSTPVSILKSPTENNHQNRADFGLAQAPFQFDAISTSNINPSDDPLKLLSPLRGNNSVAYTLESNNNNNNNNNNDSSNSMDTGADNAQSMADGFLS